MYIAVINDSQINVYIAVLNDSQINVQLYIAVNACNKICRLNIIAFVVIVDFINLSLA